MISDSGGLRFLSQFRKFSFNSRRLGKSSRMFLARWQLWDWVALQWLL
jgi:hypothetical protein